LSDLNEVPAVSLGSYIGVAVVTALIASILGPLLVNFYILFTSPGDGGVAAGMVAVLAFTMAGAFIAFPVGAVALLLIGVPLARGSAPAIQRRPWFAALTGLGAGGFLGGLAAALLGLSVTFALAALISGAVFGLLWILAVRFILLAPKRSIDA
jgi:hypothetical protein